MVVGRNFQNSNRNPGQNPDQNSNPNSDSEHSLGSHQKPLAFCLSQQQLYDDLLDAVRKLPPVEALSAFENTFFGHSASLDADVSPFLHKVLFADDEPEFRHTLKRACYIYVNNWDIARHSDMMQRLLDLFEQPSLQKATHSHSLKRLRQWLRGFANSADFEDLKLFAHQRIGPTHSGSWSSRYAAYRLTAQAINEANSLEQREAARTLSKRLKNKFKHNLAMYTAFSQNSSRLNYKYINPTVLGDEVLRLIKAILVRRGQFSYRNVARIFQQQTTELSYGNYKESLLEYLCFSISHSDFLLLVETELGKQLPKIYAEQDANTIDPSLNLRTCNRLIDGLTTADQATPSSLFVRMLSQGNPLNVVVILLKIVLISPNSQLYLESRIADLIAYYKQFMEAECRGIIQFLEICSVTFAIYSDNVEYNLVQVVPRKP
ncbi:MAG: hypothetical protein DCF25_14985 [Leptolyngbya foveolarum]|uniref:Uncharacterized protein n=1 Tax=Leptolyngbya foveolarum TaxID=47253 RepID=A0A2W4VX78_9CYAN|nr:MAG: hypothetical protein DCF25_14985 [Leptolyngbya foveolarum]